VLPHRNKVLSLNHNGISNFTIVQSRNFYFSCITHGSLSIYEKFDQMFNYECIILRGVGKSLVKRFIRKGENPAFAACHSFKNISEDRERFETDKERERKREKEKERACFRELTYSVFSSLIYLCVLHARATMSSQSRHNSMQTARGRNTTLENTTPRATLKSESIRASKLHKRRQLFSQTTQGADLCIEIKDVILETLVKSGAYFAYT